MFHVSDITVTGGDSANSELRRQMHEKGEKRGFRLHFPKIEYCTDNGAMIAYDGWTKIKAELLSPLKNGATVAANLHLK